jgi:hypothetical protein
MNMTPFLDSLHATSVGFAKSIDIDRQISASGRGDFCRTWITASVISILTLGCGSIEAEVPETSVTKQNLSFPGAPQGLPRTLPENVSPEILAALGISENGDFHLPSMTFSYGDKPVDVPDGLSSEMRVKSVTISSHNESFSLSFVHKITLSIKNLDASAEPEKVILQYPNEHTGNEPIGTSVTIPVDGIDNINDPWRIRNEQFALDIWGDIAGLPREPWAVDVTLSFSGSIAFRF